MKVIYKIIGILLLVPSVLFASELNGKYTKTKTIKKEFKVSPNALVDLHNKYGSIDVTTWNENRVVLEIIISTSSNKESKAIDKLAEISIEINGSNSNVTAKTRIGKSSSWGSNNNVSMDIKYIVKMPVSNNLNIDMNYGDVMVNKLNGNSKFNCDYGKLIAGELNGDSNNINLDYSRGSLIEKMGNGNINIDYSSLKISEAGTIVLNTDYSDTSFGSVKNLNFNADYGSVSADKAISVTGNSDYVNLAFGTIDDILIIDASYGSLKTNKMGANFSEVRIKTKYVGVKIGVASNGSFNYSIDTKYGGVSIPNSAINTKQIDKNTSKYYEGSFNGSKGKVTIVTSYGSV